MRITLEPDYDQLAYRLPKEGMHVLTLTPDCCCLVIEQSVIILL